MSLIFCRHGQTIYNTEDRFQGLCDSPLTAKGISQAKRLNEFLIKNFNVKLFIISPLHRVVDSYEYASSGLNAEIESREELKEVCYGEWEEKVRDEISIETLKKRSEHRFNFVHPGEFQGHKGESYREKAESLIPFFVELQTKYKDADYDVVILAHHGILLAAVKYFKNLNDDEINDFRAANNSMFVVDLKLEKNELKEF